MLKIKSLFFFSFLCSNLLAVDDTNFQKSQKEAEEKNLRRREEYHIDGKFSAGKNLIYDCRKKHYACVNEASYINCREERNDLIKINSESYNCAPLKQFSDKEDCVLKNYDVQVRNPLRKFCFRKPN